MHAFQCGSVSRKPEKTYAQMLDELRYDFPCEPDWVLEQVLAKHGWEKPVMDATLLRAPAEPIETKLL